MKKWTPDLELDKVDVSSVDVWIQLPGLDVKY